MTPPVACYLKDLERLQVVYPDEWGGFLGNAELVWWMATNNEGTVSYLEKVLGTRTRMQEPMAKRRTGGHQISASSPSLKVRKAKG